MALINTFFIIIVIVLFLELRKAFRQIKKMQWELIRREEWLETNNQDKRIFIKDPFFDDRISGYERIHYIPAEKIVLEGDMEQIEKEVDMNYDFYKSVLDESQKLKERHDKENISYEELAMINDEAYVCFYQPKAIRGFQEGDTYSLVNGNHRVFLAKKLGMDVPYIVLGKGRYITVYEIINRGVVDWNELL